MQRDQKIGLALGILLVGVVAAFFFRHEQSPQEPLPTLQTADELDQRIAERDRAPYLQGGEPAKPSHDDALFGPDPWNHHPGGLVPEPIPLGDELEHAAGTSSAESAKADGVTRHVVQRGETLSSIAAKHLGSATRFEEIFLANTGQLRSPDDLRVGMELRIPGRVGATDERMGATGERLRSPVPSPMDTGGPKPPPVAPFSTVAPQTADGSQAGAKFEAYRRSPLTPQGTDPQSTTLDPKDQARRRLTQLPPRGDVSPPR